ncbi:MAG: Beta-hexosaminidase [Holosporales bacterium]
MTDIQIKENSKPVILGIKGDVLNKAEIDLFKKYKPAGFILFQRNCNDQDQVKRLVLDLKDLLQCNCPILIDQEGGRVSRLKSPHFKEYKAPGSFLLEKDVYENARNMARDLANIGINVNCTPLLDLVFDQTHDIIGDRSFGADPIRVSKMAESVIKGHFDEGVMPVIKHLPGHGRATVDSHEALPRVLESESILKETDFKAFKCVLESLKGYPTPWGMTAHIVFNSIDSINCATQSEFVIQRIIKEYIGFEGVLLSDCVTMKALEGTFSDRVKKSLDAGCTIALHCSGDINEMEEILKSKHF